MKYKIEISKFDDSVEDKYSKWKEVLVQTVEGDEFIVRKIIATANNLDLISSAPYCFGIPNLKA